LPSMVSAISIATFIVDVEPRRSGRAGQAPPLQQNARFAAVTESHNALRAG
jgi:hypothetical protein